MLTVEYYDGAPSLPGSRCYGSLRMPGRFTRAFFKAVLFSLRGYSKTGEDSWATVYVNGKYYCTLLYSPVLEGVSIARVDSLGVFWMDKGALHDDRQAC